MTCESCQERLLDYVFGLLDGSELEQIRGHLDGCSHCQASLAKAKSQQSLMGHAAKAVTRVGEFTLPSHEPVAPTVPMTIPMTAAKRPMWRRAWVAWSAAAAVLIVAGLSVAYYQNTHDRYLTNLTASRNDHKKLADEFASLPVKHETLHKTALADLRGKTGPYLHVVGPRTLQPGAKAHLHITTRHIEGTPAAANLRIKLIEADTKNVVQMVRPQCDRDGQAVVEIDAGAARPGLLQLVIDAETGAGSTRVEEVLRLVDPTFVTRIDTNKVAYQTKDVLFFRVLALDRYNLQPPAQPIPLRVDLVDAKGKAVRTLEMPTGDGGILAREFAIDDKFAAGSYTLNVRPVDPAKTNVQTASQPIEIVRQLPTPDLVLTDKDRYFPGEKITGSLRSSPGKLPTNVQIDGQLVPFTAEPEATLAAPGGIGGGGPNITQPKGKDDKNAKFKQMAKAPEKAAADLLYRFSAGPIPQKLAPGAREVRMVIPVQDGKKKVEIQSSIPIAPTEFTIDLFPEGGELIAGMQNRVFYRVRSKSGEPVTGAGKVLLMTGKNKLPLPDLDSSYEFGMGYLDFVPDANEIYTICVTTPAKTEHLINPFAKLGGIRSEGVVLQIIDPLGEERVPKAVGNQGDPIRVTLHRQGTPRKLLVLAQCRGQIVDQRWVEVKQGTTDVTLHPTADANGLIRVTAYEVIDNPLRNTAANGVVGFAHVNTDRLFAGMLQPIAERLVYRAAPQLELGFALNTNNLEPAKKMQAKVSATDDKGQPAAAWVLASAVDERFQSRPRSLSAHFQIVNEVRTGADLDNAQLILHDAKDKESVQVLERFLGTHGWRRFLRAEEFTVGTAPGRYAQPLVFSRESTPLEVMQRQYEQSVAMLDAKIRLASRVEVDALEAQRDRAREALTVAANKLATFEESVQVGVRMALGTVLLVLFGISLILMAIGVYRVARQHSATPAFGGSFACVAACLGLLLVNALMGAPNVTVQPIAERGPAAWEVSRDLDHRLARGPELKAERAERLEIGAFSVRNGVQKFFGRGGDDVKKPGGPESEVTFDTLRTQLAQAFTRRTRGEALAEVEMRDRENKNAAKGAQPYNQFFGAKADAAPMPPPPAVVGDQKKGSDVAAPRKYAYEHDDSFADTLLWHPNLKLDNGQAELRFDIGNGSQTYRVLLLGHDAHGRFGFYEKRLDVVGP